MGAKLVAVALTGVLAAFAANTLFFRVIIPLQVRTGL